MKTTLFYLGSTSFTNRETGEIVYSHYFCDENVGSKGYKPFGKCVNNKPMTCDVLDEVQVDVAIYKDYQKITLL